MKKVATRVVILSIMLFSCSPGKQKFFKQQPSDGSPRPEAGTTVIPPSPVIGSYLNGVLWETDGSPSAQAKISLIKTDISITTNQNGEFSLPIENINSASISLKIETSSKRIISTNLTLPADINVRINKARLESGLPPLEGAYDEQTALNYSEPKRLGLQLPANGVADNENQVVVVSSLPSTSAPKGSGIYSRVENESTDSSIRFKWKDSSNDQVKSTFVFAKSEAVLSEWDGNSSSIPAWEGMPLNSYAITNFNQCNDTQYRTTDNGEFLSNSESMCGFLRSEFPFNQPFDVFVRLVSDSPSQTKLSQVFKIPARNNAPSLSAINNQSIYVNTTLNQIPVQLTDNDSNLTCAAALSAQSGNKQLIADEQIVVGGTIPNCHLSFFPAKDQYGTAVIKVAASDGALTARRVFELNVVDAPILVASNLTGLKPNLRGACNNKSTNFSASSTHGVVQTVKCNSGVLEVVLHLPASATSQTFEVSVSSTNENGQSSPIQRTNFNRLPFMCPENYVGVPGSRIAGLGHIAASNTHNLWWLNTDNDFCVMKYPAKDNNGKTFASSTIAGLPWVNITRGVDESTAGSALKACKDTNAALGMPGTFRLISNTQWQTIARNAENVAGNWSGGAVGLGVMARGHNDGNPLNPLENESDDKPYAGTLNTETDPVGTGWEQKRTRQLSNGEVIWDIGGNVQNWVSDSALELGMNPTLPYSWQSFSDTLNFPLGGINRLIFAPQGNYGSGKNIGAIYGIGIVPATSVAVRRGSSWGGCTADCPPDSGAFTGAYNLNNDETANFIGFRCVYQP